MVGRGGINDPVGSKGRGRRGRHEAMRAGRGQSGSTEYRADTIVQEGRGERSRPGVKCRRGRKEMAGDK